MMKLNEGPEEVVLPSGRKLSFRAGDAYAFGYDTSSHEMKVGRSETHGEAGLRGSVGTGSYLGRLWLDDKVMVFWNYPDSYKELKILLSDLKQKFKEKYDLDLDFTKGWRLEVPYDPEEGREDWDELAMDDHHIYYNESEYTRLIPLHKFEGLKNISDKVRKLRQKRKEKHLDPGYSGGDADEGTYQYMKMRGKQKGDRYKGGSEERRLGYSTDDPEFSKDIERFREVVRESIRGILKESPDGVKADDHENLSTDINVTSRDAYPFGFGEDLKPFIGRASDLHGEIGDRYRDESVPPQRPYFKYPGRFWTGEKVISFWEYPESKMKLKELLKKLEGEFESRFDKKLQFDKNWRIEVVDNYEEVIDGEENIDWLNDTELIPISKYAGSEEWSEKEKTKDHEDPDIGAGGVDKGTYKSKKQKGKEKERYPGGGESEKFGYQTGPDPEYSDELERFREVVRRKVSKLLSN